MKISNWDFLEEENTREQRGVEQKLRQQRVTVWPLGFFIEFSPSCRGLPESREMQLRLWSVTSLAVVLQSKLKWETPKFHTESFDLACRPFSFQWNERERTRVPRVEEAHEGLWCRPIGSHHTSPHPPQVTSCPACWLVRRVKGGQRRSYPFLVFATPGLNLLN